MSNIIFNNKIKLIDSNIKLLNSNTLNLKDSLKLLNSTTNVLSEANDLILSQYNTINEDTNYFLGNNSLEPYYNILIIRKKSISDLTEKYSKIAKNDILVINNEENLDDDIDNENNTLLKKKQNPIELGFIMDKNEALMKKGNKDLEEICNDMGEIKNNINEQGKNLNDIEEVADMNEMKEKKGDAIVKDIIYSQNCTKIALTVVNVLLFALLIAIIIFKLL